MECMVSKTLFVPKKHARKIETNTSLMENWSKHNFFKGLIKEISIEKHHKTIAVCSRV